MKRFTRWLKRWNCVVDEVKWWWMTPSTIDCWATSWPSGEPVIEWQSVVLFPSLAKSIKKQWMVHSTIENIHTGLARLFYHDFFFRPLGPALCLLLPVSTAHSTYAAILPAAWATGNESLRLECTAVRLVVAEARDDTPNDDSRSRVFVCVFCILFCKADGVERDPLYFVASWQRGTSQT